MAAGFIIGGYMRYQSCAMRVALPCFHSQRNSCIAISLRAVGGIFILL